MQMTKMVALAAAFSAFAFSANAVNTVTITGNIPSTDLAGVNNYIDEINAAFGGSSVFGDSAFFTLNMNSILTFTAVAAESERDNSFVATGAGMLSENSDFGEGTDFMTSALGGSVSGAFSAGSLDGLLQFLSNVPGNDAVPGDVEFGVFLPFGAQSGDQFSKFFLAFDDGASIDDNHDDYIIRVDVAPIPLPASVLMLLAALGGLGVVSRRRA